MKGTRKKRRKITIGVFEKSVRMKTKWHLHLYVTVCPFTTAHDLSSRAGQRSGERDILHAGGHSAYLYRGRRSWCRPETGAQYVPPEDL